MSVIIDNVGRTAGETRRLPALARSLSGIAALYAGWRARRQIEAMPYGMMKDVGFPSAGGSDVHRNARRKEG